MRLGQRQRNLQRAPDHLDQLLADDHAAHGDQDLLQVLAVHRPHDEALERQADRAGHQHRHQHRRQHRHQVAPQARASRSSRPCRPSTLVATKAPSAMNTPWPKFSTSIRPNTSVRPEAMMKMIMPIARPATVSVSQVEAEPMKRQHQRAPAPAPAPAASSRSRAFFIAPAPAASAAAPRRRPDRCHASRRAPRAPLSITATVSPSRLAKLMFCSTSRMVTPLRLELREGVDHVVDDGRRQALARLVDDQQLARLDDRARHRQHLLLPARQLAGRMVPELLHRREQREDPLQPRVVHLRGALRAARGQQHVFLHRQVGEDAHVLGHVGDAEPGDLRRAAAA